jgi:pyruvate kinase
MRDPVLTQAFERRGAVTRVAKALGISTAAVSTWRKVPKSRVPAVAEVLGVPPHDLRPDLYDPPASPDREAVS